MTNDQWVRVRSLFEAAVDREPADAAAWLARQVGDDATVLAEVESLLKHHSRAGSFLSAPAAERLPDLLALDDDEDHALAPGAAIGSYTVIRELGRGGMGRVYLASDARLGRTVALKALAPHLVRDPLHRERLRREARAAAALTHPGICTVYALEEVKGELYIATEFVDGQTLGEEIRSGRRPTPDEILRVAREIAAALAAAHAAGIVHRDLKPDNVMRCRDGRLKILDFGLARIDSPAHKPAGPPVTQPGMLIGTPAYMAPEQINGQAADARADVFAFGVLMYEFASGVNPFAAATPLATAARVLESDVRPIDARYPGIPAAFADLISRCLRKVPTERFASAVEIGGALELVATESRRPRSRAQVVWWRAHQIIVIVLYVVSAAVAWQIKDWIETPVTVSIFVALGAAATIGGVFRGHLIFTEAMNTALLPGELRRALRATRIVDVMMAALMLVDGVIVATSRALPGVFTVSLAVGVALAALVLEPATTRAAFGDE